VSRSNDCQLAVRQQAEHVLPLSQSIHCPPTCEAGNKQEGSPNACAQASAKAWATPALVKALELAPAVAGAMGATLGLTANGWAAKHWPLAAWGTRKGRKDV
jgi:hypothetical protein